MNQKRTRKIETYTISRNQWVHIFSISLIGVIAEYNTIITLNIMLYAQVSTALFRSNYNLNLIIL